MVKLPSSTKHALCAFCIKQYQLCDWCNYHDFVCHGDYLPSTLFGSAVKWKHSGEFSRQICLLRQRGSCHRCHHDMQGTANLKMLKPPNEGGTFHPRNIVLICSDCVEAIKRENSATARRAADQAATQKRYGSYWAKVLHPPFTDQPPYDPVAIQNEINRLLQELAA